MKKPTLASLFDGSGGFPLAATICGIEPVWASEVEPYPIAVTRSRFPNMKHYGDVSKINGAEVEPVDIISFGSPCQDLSVAGKRKGLKHVDNGDDETTRSGLFMEAIRIAKEMREATNGRYPNFLVYENVPGAFSSNHGEDFRTVLEELIKIVEPTAVMPAVPKGGWAYADCYIGDGWSLAYRVLDAQYIRTAQRRRRIFLVFDLTGQRAFKILFEREGVRGDSPTCGAQGQAVARNAADGIGADDREGACCGFPLGFRPENVRLYDEAATTLCNGTRAGFCNGVVYDTRGNGDGSVVPTITGDHENRVTDYTAVVCLEGNGSRPSHRGDGYDMNCPMYTLNTIERHAVAYGIDQQGGKGGANYTCGVAPTLCSDSHGTPHAVAFQTYQKCTCPLMANSHPGSYTGQDAFNDMLVAGAYSFDSLSSNSMKSSNPNSGCRRVEVAKCLDTTDPNPSKNQGGIAVVHLLQAVEVGGEDENQ